jgi:peptide/nickel transport system permease protein
MAIGRRYRILACLGLLVAATFAVLHTDLGWSPSYSAPVSQAIAERLPATIELACFAFIAVVVLGAILGFVRARARGVPVLREVLAVAELAGRALPVAILAVFLQLLLLFKTSVPIAGMSTGEAFDARDQLMHLIAPVLCLALPFGAWASVIFYDFFRASDDASRRAVRSLVGPVAATAWAIGPALLTAIFLIEPRFAWPGIARLFFNGVSQVDVALAGGCLLVYAVGVAFIKLCAALSPDAQGSAPARAINAPRTAASRRKRTSVIGAIAFAVLVAAVLGAVGASVIAPIGPYFIDQAHWQGYPLAPGTAGHILGTEENGRDLLARLLVGLRTSLGIALAAAVIAAAVAAVVAKALKALPWFDRRGALTTAGIRPFAAFPFILAIVMLLFVKFHGTGFLTPPLIALIIAVVSWPAIVPAFRALGTSRLAAVVDLTSVALLLEVTQSSMGFGVQPPGPTLGNMLVNAQSNITVAPWAAIVPSVVIVVMLFALYAVADELRERARPAT